MTKYRPKQSTAIIQSKSTEIIIIVVITLKGIATSRERYDEPLSKISISLEARVTSLPAPAFAYDFWFSLSNFLNNVPKIATLT